MFQMLDEELGPVSTQFAFDHFRQHSEDKTTVRENSSLGQTSDKGDPSEVAFFSLSLTQQT